jgi:hypothetical protein
MEKIFLLPLIVTTLVACSDSKPNTGRLAMIPIVHSIDGFWPPDLVPHPELPQPKPEDDNA